MSRLSYNTNFEEVTTPILSAVNELMRSYNYSSRTNGYITDKNNAYFNGFSPSKKAFPKMIAVIVENDWKFQTNYGREFDSKTWQNSNLGGRLVFDETVKITLRIYHERFDLDSLKEFKPELEEFKNINPRVIEFKFEQQDSAKRKITKANVKTIITELASLLPKFFEEIEQATIKQAARRFNELYAADEETAMKCLSQEAKDMFIF